MASGGSPAGARRWISTESKERELAILVVRAFRLPDSIVGEQEAACKWLASNNRRLDGRPIDLIAQRPITLAMPCPAPAT